MNTPNPRHTSVMEVTLEESELINNLRSGDHDTVFSVVQHVLRHYVRPLQEGMRTPEDAADFDTLKNAPERPPYIPPPPSKFRLWLMRHGFELEYSDHIESTGGFQRHIAIVINHHFYGVGIMLDPFKGVFEDELNTPHAEIAAQHEKGAR